MYSSWSLNIIQFGKMQQSLIKFAGLISLLITIKKFRRADRIIETRYQMWLKGYTDLFSRNSPNLGVINFLEVIKM